MFEKYIFHSGPFYATCSYDGMHIAVKSKFDGTTVVISPVQMKRVKKDD